MASGLEILKAKHAGFCYGVERATRLALELEAGEGRPIFTLGPLMHNPQEVERLRRLGIVPLDRIDDCVGGKTLIRTHGIGKEEVARARQLGVDLVDTTCPHVKVPRRHIEEYGRHGRVVFLLGDEGHPEVQAILSYRTGTVVVVSGPDDLPELDPGTLVGVVAQTTQSKRVFQQVVNAARLKYRDVASECTVCDDTARRQEEGVLLAHQVDLMVVVGGRNSANTNRLANICRAIQPRTCHIECADELFGVSFEGVSKIGISSGASTPDWVIHEVDSWLARQG
jgi:4-hydroxy-3-methylbut-2-enyl diphosphate reductase